MHSQQACAVPSASWQATSRLRGKMLENLAPPIHGTGERLIDQAALHGPGQVEGRNCCFTCHTIPNHGNKDRLITKQRGSEDSLIGCSPDEVTVHGAILQLTGGHPVQRTAESGAISWIGAVGFHTADGLTHKVAQGWLPPATHCPIPAHQMVLSCQSRWLMCAHYYLKVFQYCIASKYLNHL